MPDSRNRNHPGTFPAFRFPASGRFGPKNRQTALRNGAVFCRLYYFRAERYEGIQVLGAASESCSQPARICLLNLASRRKRSCWAEAGGNFARGRIPVERGEKTKNAARGGTDDRESDEVDDHKANAERDAVASQERPTQNGKQNSRREVRDV